MGPELIQQFPQFALLILAGLAYAWLHKQHREERKERDIDWRGFLDSQRKEFGATIERVVGDFREWIAQEREVQAGELRKVTDALREHDSRAASLGDKIATAAQGAVAAAAAAAAAQTVKEIRSLDRQIEREAPR